MSSVVLRNAFDVMMTARVDPATGRPSGAAQLTPSTDRIRYGFDLAVRNGNGLVVSENRGGVLRIADGVLSSGLPSRVIVSKGHPSDQPIAVSNGTNYLVVWQNELDDGGAQFWGARIRASDRTVLDPTGFLIASGSVSSPALASDGTDYLIAYVGPGNTVTVRRIRSSDAFPEHPIAVGGGDSVAVASDGTNYLVAWTKSRVEYAGDHGVVAARRLKATTRDFVDADPIVLTSSPTDRALGPVTVAVDNPLDPAKKTFLLAWKDQNQLRASRVRALSGAAVDVDNGHIALGHGQGAKHLMASSNGTDFVVAWYHDRQGNPVPPNAGRGFFATRIDALNGTVLDGVSLGYTGVLVAEGSNNDNVSSPALSFNGRSYWLTWGAFENANELIHSVRGVRLTPSLGPLDPKPGAVLVSGITGFGAEGGFGPSLASRRNGESLLVYSRYDGAPDALGLRVKARVLTDDGQSTIQDAGADAADASSGPDGGPSDAGQNEADASSADASNDSAAPPADSDPPPTGGPDDPPAGDPSPTAPSSSDGGSGCQMTPASAEPTWLAFPSLGALAAFVKRRRRPRSAAT